jgi:hypothetical protein
VNFLENKYVYLVGGRCRNFKRISDSVYQMSCPICGDSKTHPRKARGYVTEKHDKPWYTCHKCGASMPLHRFIQAVDATMYGEYQKERVSAGLWRRSGSLPRVPVARPQPVAAELPDSARDADPLLPLSRVDSLKPDHYARILCEKRKLPDLTRVYHCPAFYAWTNFAMKTEKFGNNALHYDHPRLVIPFLDADGKMYAFQGRDYRPDSDNKYTTIRIDESVPKIYGLDRYDGDRPGYAVEGPIDSMFLPNAVAFAGGTHGILKDLKGSCSPVVVYDNEPRSRHTVKKLMNALYDGYRVCIWPERVVQKDVNDMVLAGLDPKSIIDQNTYGGLRGALELSKWRK